MKFQFHTTRPLWREEGASDVYTETSQAQAFPILNITKHAKPDTVHPGDLLTYILAVSNTGQVTATNLIISDTMPISTTYQSCSGRDSCGGSNGVVTWMLGALPVNHLVYFTFTVRVGSYVNPDMNIVNQTYRVTSSAGVTATGVPITTTVSEWAIYMPLVVRNHPPTLQWRSPLRGMTVQ
ncbi:MAG TPA: DUF11 domain-containing protein [Thermoflexia bacterium]|nr:DUF11 domain-containing protein [Thermoflexia bacterium]